MPSIAVKIDWITVTGKANTDDIVGGHLNALTAEMFCKDKLAYLLQDFLLLEQKKGNGFYPYEFVDKVTGVKIALSDKLEKQGWKVEMPGSAALSPEHRQHLLQRACDAGWNITRLDVAFDLMNSVYTPFNLAMVYETTEHKRRTLRTDFIKSAKGDTFYIGSRSSERYLRIYDKGKEQGLANDWTRIEIELKGAQAAHWSSIVAYDPAQVAQEIREVYDCPGSLIDNVLASFWDGVTRSKEKPPYVAPDTEVWFRTQVSEAFRKLCHDDRAAAQRILEGLHQYFAEGSKIDPRWVDTSE